MDLDDGGVDHGVFHIRFFGACLKKPNENTGFDPVAVSREGTVPLAEDRRKITPRAPRPHDPKHCLDKQPIVVPAPSRVLRLAQTVWFHLRPLGVRQYESFHSKLESQSSPMGNPEYQQALERLGISFGHRKRLLRAIAELKAAPPGRAP